MDITIEAWHRSQGTCIFGVDEVGRGCLAGPVVAAAACLNYDSLSALPAKHRALITDSKALTHAKRQQALGHLTSIVIFQAVGLASVTEIDTVGILNATFIAMRRALDQLIPRAPLPFHVLVDGHMKIRECHYPQTPIIDGDAKCIAISAASIIAKEHRDALMRDYHHVFPEYGFGQHMGYGTKQHLSAIDSHGVSVLHRHSFAPVRKAAERALSVNDR